MIDNFYIIIFCCLFLYWIYFTFYIGYKKIKESDKRVLKYNIKFNFNCVFKSIGDLYFLDYENCNNILKRKDL